MPGHKPKSRIQPEIPFSGDYIWVQTKESSFWRRKRGTVKPAKLNESFKKNVELAKLTGPAAKRIVSKIYSYLEHLTPGRIILRISNLLIKTLKTQEKVNFSLFKNFEFQEKFTLHNLVPGIQVRKEKHELKVGITVGDWSFPHKTKLLTDYYFDLVLLLGDPLKEKSLRIESMTTNLIPYPKKSKKNEHNLSVFLPDTKKCWMAILKINSLEGNEFAAHPRHYAMGVIATG